MSSILIYDRISVSLSLGEKTLARFAGSALFAGSGEVKYQNRQGKPQARNAKGTFQSLHLTDPPAGNMGAFNLIRLSQSRPYQSAPSSPYAARRNVLAPSEIRRLSGSFVRQASIQAVVRLLGAAIQHRELTSAALNLKVFGWELALDTTHRSYQAARDSLTAATANTKAYPHLSQYKTREWKNYHEWGASSLNASPHRNERLKLYLKTNAKGGFITRFEYAWKAGMNGENHAFTAPAPVLSRKRSQTASRFRLVETTDNRRLYWQSLFDELETRSSEHRERLRSLTT